MEMTPPVLYMLIGPPGSGKSTWREQHVRETKRPVAVVSSDDLVEEYAAAHGMTYSEAFPNLNQKDVKRRINSAFETASSRGQDIILDRTNLTKGGRSSFLSRLPKYYIRKAVVFLPAREDLNRRLEKRARETGKSIPAKVVDDMLAKFEPPTQDEGFHELIVVPIQEWIEVPLKPD